MAQVRATPERSMMVVVDPEIMILDWVGVGGDVTTFVRASLGNCWPASFYAHPDYFLLALATNFWYRSPCPCRPLRVFRLKT